MSGEPVRPPTASLDGLRKTALSALRFDTRTLAGPVTSAGRAGGLLSTSGITVRVLETPTLGDADLAQVLRRRRVSLIDVRRSDEHERASIAGALNIPLHELRDQLDQMLPGELWVHCAGGYRASVAASLLDASGFDVVAIDDAFEHARRVGLPVTDSAGA